MDGVDGEDAGRKVTRGEGQQPSLRVTGREVAVACFANSSFARTARTLHPPAVP